MVTSCWAALLLTQALGADSAYEDRTCRVDTPVPVPDGAKWGYITASGRRIPARFDAVSYFLEDVARVCASNRCGLIDAQSRFVTPLHETNRSWSVSGYSEGLAAVSAKEGWGYIDLRGDVVIPLRYQWAGSFHCGIARVRKEDQYFFINHSGEQVTPEFKGAFDFHDKLAAVSVENERGYISEDGHFAIQPQYSTAGDFSEGLAPVRVKGQAIYIDTKGQRIFSAPFREINAFSDGLAVVGDGGLSGYINRRGKLVIPLKFQIAHKFAEGVASVRTGEKWGYIDHNGRFVLPPQYDSALPFCAGLAQVIVQGSVPKRNPDSRVRGGLEGIFELIDHSGRVMWRDSDKKPWVPGHVD
jgi:hypothetical protein